MRAVSLGVVVLAVISGSGQARTWTDVDGRAIEAEFQRLEGEEVVLRMGERDFRVPLARLSEADRAHAKEAAAGPKPGAESAPAAGGPIVLNDVELQPGGPVVRVEIPMEGEDLAKAKGSKRPTERSHLGISLAPGFNPAVPGKFLIVCTPVNGPQDLERGSIPTIGQFRDEAHAAGWSVIAMDGDSGYPEGDAYRPIYGTAYRAMAAAWRGFKDSKFATAGFSGGGKNGMYAAGVTHANGLKVIGVYASGCNEDRLTDAADINKMRRADLKEIRVFLSNGKDDKTASPERAAVVAKSLDSLGVKEVRLVEFDGGHKNHRPHLSDALAWFEEP